jgi:ABC-2 type transport system ATP-binding protein
MRQRVGLAQSIINDPDLLILDEPSAGLDPEERTRILNLVSMVSGHGRIFLSTHVVVDLEQLATHILVMHDGRLLAEGTPREIADYAAGRAHGITMPSELWARLAPVWTMRQRTPDIPLVANVRIAAGQVAVRVLADEPPMLDDAVVAPEIPTLSDGYLALTGLGGLAATP